MIREDEFVGWIGRLPQPILALACVVVCGLAAAKAAL
jgi:hypothetical protein